MPKMFDEKKNELVEYLGEISVVSCDDNCINIFDIPSRPIWCLFWNIFIFDYLYVFTYSLMQQLKLVMEESIKTDILFQGVQPTGIRVVCQKSLIFS